jgi:hypothetical protein
MGGEVRLLLRARGDEVVRRMDLPRPRAVAVLAEAVYEGSEAAVEFERGRGVILSAARRTTSRISPPCGNGTHTTTWVTCARCGSSAR